MTRPKARSNAREADTADDVVMQDAAESDHGAAVAGTAAAAEPSAAMQRAAELVQRRVNLEVKLRDIDHMVRWSACRYMLLCCPFDSFD